MNRILPLTSGLALCVLASCATTTQETSIKGDEFVLRYEVELPKSDLNQLVVWVPFPTSDGVQQIELLESPTESILSEPDSYGNRFASVTRPTTESLVWEYKVRRVMDEGGQLEGAPLAAHLKPNRLVPVGGESSTRAHEAVSSFKDANPSRAIYNRVLEDMRYDKSGSGWGTGSTDWACEAGYGNCTDFHALFISMTRSLNIPAKFTIGFPVPTGEAGEIKGYHCWAHFWEKGVGWVPVDISEADKDPEKVEFFYGTLDANRVSFSNGRDLVLSPPQKGAPLNYFVKAYAEKNGTPFSVKTKVSYSR